MNPLVVYPKPIDYTILSIYLVSSSILWMFYGYGEPEVDCIIDAVIYKEDKNIALN